MTVDPDIHDRVTIAPNDMFFLRPVPIEKAAGDIRSMNLQPVPEKVLLENILQRTEDNDLLEAAETPTNHLVDLPRVEVFQHITEHRHVEVSVVVLYPVLNESVMDLMVDSFPGQHLRSLFVPFNRDQLHGFPQNFSGHPADLSGACPEVNKGSGGEFGKLMAENRVAV